MNECNNDGEHKKLEAERARGNRGRERRSERGVCERIRAKQRKEKKSV